MTTTEKSTRFCRPQSRLFYPLKEMLVGVGAVGCFSLFVACGSFVAADQPVGKVVFSEDFEAPEKARERFEFVDPQTWRLAEIDGNGVMEITARGSAYKPPHRSPLHIALVRDLEVGNCEIRFRVRSTKDTGNHRDCCVFFGYQDAANFYYVHLGARPDPHSGQIMVVDDAPRKALTENKADTPWDDQWHNVLLRRNIETGQIEIFFDDMKTPHMSVRDETFGKGRVGIGSFDDMNAFDDLTVVAF